MGAAPPNIIGPSPPATWAISQQRLRLATTPGSQVLRRSGVASRSLRRFNIINGSGLASFTSAALGLLAITVLRRGRRRRRGVEEQSPLPRRVIALGINDGLGLFHQLFQRFELPVDAGEPHV